MTEKLRFKNKLKRITKRNRGASIEAILKRLGSSVTGWLGYYAIADMSSAMEKLAKFAALLELRGDWKGEAGKLAENSISQPNTEA
jgi:hypothetical protein